MSKSSGASSNQLVIVLRVRSAGAKASQFFRTLSILRDEHPALSDTVQLLFGKERETPVMAGRSSTAPFHPSRQSPARVYPKTRTEQFRFIRHLRGTLGGSIDKHRHRANPGNRSRCRKERITGRDHLVIADASPYEYIELSATVLRH